MINRRVFLRFGCSSLAGSILAPGMVARGGSASTASRPNVLLEHRALLAKFAREHNDPLAAALLADDVSPRPFTAEAPRNSKAKRGKKAAAPASQERINR